MRSLISILLGLIIGLNIIFICVVTYWMVTRHKAETVWAWMDIPLDQLRTGDVLFVLVVLFVVTNRININSDEYQ